MEDPAVCDRGLFARLFVTSELIWKRLVDRIILLTTTRAFLPLIYSHIDPVHVYVQIRVHMVSLLTGEMIQW